MRPLENNSLIPQMCSMWLLCATHCAGPGNMMIGYVNMVPACMGSVRAKECAAMTGAQSHEKGKQDTEPHWRRDAEGLLPLCMLYQVVPVQQTI